jgi:expansin
MFLERLKVCPVKILAILTAGLTLAIFAALGPSQVSGQALKPVVWMPVIARGNTNPVHSGVATYYYATGEGACGFPASPGNLMVAAMNQVEYAGSAVCGEYVHVKGPKGEVTVRIVDLCPGCGAGHLDLSQEAFAAIADLPQGRVNITWQVVSPEISGPIVYHFKDGSNPWWTAVQIRNHRNPIAKFEFLNGGGQWQAVERLSYNYFVQTNLGSGPFTFRVTDSYGNVLTNSGIPLLDNADFSGTGQFPFGP